MCKFLDKLITNRITYHVERNQKISKHQYGYSKGHTTVQAIEKVLATIKDNKNKKKHSLLVTLDMANAFNSAWIPAIHNEMVLRQIPRNLIKIALDFLTDRTVTSNNVKRNIMRGCLQGSCLGPILRNILMEGWFRKFEEEGNENEEGDLVQAFADNQIIIISGKLV